MKIIVTDLDGTLLNDNGKPSEFTKSTIRRISKDNILIAASGRGMSGIKNCLDDIIDCFDYFICGNGSYACDENGNIIYEKLLSEDKTNFICGLAKRLETDFRVMKYDKCETLRGEEETFNEARKNGFEVIRTDKFSSGYKAVISGNTDKIEETILKLQKEKLDRIDYVRSDLHNLNIFVIATKLIARILLRLVMRAMT